MPQIKVASKNDECLVGWYNTEWLFASPTYDLHVGYLYAGWYKLGNASIFRNVRVPQGKLIQSARVTYTAFSDAQRDDVNSYIHGERNPHPLPFSTYEDYAARVRTGARVTWDAIPHWTHQKEYQTPDLKAIIQEIVNLPEWEEGDDICIFWHDHDDRTTHEIETYRNAYPYFTDPLLAPLLTIHWLEDTLLESYTIGGDTWFYLGSHDRLAQTFIPQSSFDLLFLDLNAVFKTPWSFPRAHIKKALNDIGPYGATLSASKLKAYVPTYDTGKYRIRLEMERITLEEGVTYGIDIFSPYDPWPDSAVILFDQGDATYPRGNKLHSSDGGISWTPDWNDDVLFALFGSPPSPPSPPEPPVRNWTILDIKQAITATGFRICVITNVPCHLYLMWTKKEPNKHKIVGLRRGDLSLRETRYCFTGWHKNEQEEAGDTLTHTFYKEPWPVCETRWFTFKGDVETLWTASAGPIFKKHRPSPPVTRYFYPDKDPEEKSIDGMTARAITYPGELWPILYGGPGTTGEAAGRTFWLEFFATSTENQWCRIMRDILLFDTSIIPPGSTILNAKLSVRVYYRGQRAEWPLFSVVVVKSFPDSNTDLVPADYHHLATTPLSNVILVSTDPEAGWYHFTFNATGRNAVIPGGITKLGLRDYHYDCLNHEPLWINGANAKIQFESADCPYPLRIPCLEVTYQPPS